ncbi:hypothetical protein AAEH95_03920 [Shewanella xiamenensis]|uniref:hypothetical protein n=1 Tax=Shewanella xiamenensis TaxID=332186 RepID=UPI00313DC248
MIYLSFFFLIVFSSGILFLENYRIKRHGADTLTLFLLIYYIQIIFPLYIFSINFIFYEGKVNTDNFFFDKVLNGVDSTVLSLVSSFSVIFLFLLYWFTQYLFLHICEFKYNFRIRLVARKSLLLFINVLGVISGLYLISILAKGESLLVGYANLIAFRSLSDGIERNFINANLFSLTQSFLFFSVLLLFCFAKNTQTGEIGRRKYLIFSLIFILAVFCVARRSFLIPVLLWFMTMLLLTGKTNFLAYLKLLLPLSILVFFGKNLLSFFSGARSVAVVNDDFGFWQFVLKVTCDVGITNVESFATFLYMTDYIRYGQDHVYSILQRVPDGTLGFDMGLPERIVRISTEIFTDKYQADIPPGFIGQMWLDFNVFGPVLYSASLSLLMFFVEFVRRLFLIDAVSCSFFSLIIFIFFLPLNSGSLDFNFSIDILFVFFLFPFCFKLKRHFVE